MKKILISLLIFSLSVTMSFAGPLNNGPVHGGGGGGGGVYDSTAVAITGGTIDGAAIGGTTPAAANFTALTGKRTASAVDYNPSALTTDYIIAVTNTDAARAVTISTEDEDSGTTSQPRIMIVKDESGGAAAHNITVSLESTGNIDGSASYVIDQNYQSITLYMDGTNAWIY